MRSWTTGHAPGPRRGLARQESLRHLVAVARGVGGGRLSSDLRRRARYLRSLDGRRVVRRLSRGASRRSRPARERAARWARRAPKSRRARLRPPARSRLLPGPIGSEPSIGRGLSRSRRFGSGLALTHLARRRGATVGGRGPPQDHRCAVCRRRFEPAPSGRGTQVLVLQQRRRRVAPRPSSEGFDAKGRLWVPTTVTLRAIQEVHTLRPVRARCESGRHKAMKGDTVRPASPATLEDARRVVARVVEHDNHERLHSAIGYVGIGTPTLIAVNARPLSHRARAGRCACAYRMAHSATVVTRARRVYPVAGCLRRPLAASRAAICPTARTGPPPDPAGRGARP